MTIYDEYEKTILKQISAYKEFGNFYVSDEDFEDLAKLLKIEKSKWLIVIIVQIITLTI